MGNCSPARLPSSVPGMCVLCASLASIFFASAAVNAQAVSAGALEAKALAPHAAATIRYAETLQVPQTNGSSVPIRVELGSWHLSGKSTEIQIPPQKGDYIAELRNGEVTTMIDGDQRVRPRDGAFWTVRSGQAMTATITGKRQSSAVLRIFSITP